MYIDVIYNMLSLFSCLIITVVDHSTTSAIMMSYHYDNARYYNVCFNYTTVQDGATPPKVAYIGTNHVDPSAACSDSLSKSFQTYLAAKLSKEQFKPNP